MFSIKRLRVTFRLLQGSFANNGDNYDTFVIDDAAVQAKINVASNGQNDLEMSIYGVPNEVINRMTVTKGNPKITDWIPNTVLLELLDNQGNPSLLFSGQIILAVADYNSAPDVPLQIIATGWYQAALTVGAYSFKGTSKVSEIMQVLANEANMGFVNHGVDTTLSDVSLKGDLWSMISEIANSANIEFYIENASLHIAPIGTPRELETVTISRENGMVGYPKVIDDGLLVTCTFNNNFVLTQKANVYVKEIEMAQGEFIIRAINHTVDTQTTNGRWYSDLSLSYWAE